MFENKSEREIELILWEIGTTIHKKSPQERSNLIESIFINKDLLSGNALNHFVGYVMHSYFYNMLVRDRRNIIKILTDDQSFEFWRERAEMLGILFKQCPRDLKIVVWEYIYAGADCSIETDLDCIAFCNTVRYIYDELSKDRQNLLYKKLSRLKDRYGQSPIMTTIDYTLNNINKLRR